MPLADYPHARFVDIKIRAARIASLPIDQLAELGVADPAVVEALHDALALACDELDVQTDIQREAQR
jgi:hypothetical protein